MNDHVQIIGKAFDFVFSETAIYRLRFIDSSHLDVTVVADPGYPKDTLNHFEISMTELHPNVYLITWIEPATGNTVTHVDDFARKISYTNITDFASKGFWRLKGEIKSAPPPDSGPVPTLTLPTASALPKGHEFTPEENKELVVEFYELAFNQHQPREAAQKYIGDRYIQHNPFVPNGAEPFYLHFESYFKEHPQSRVVFSHVIADGDLVILHLNSKADEKDLGRAIVDIFRMENGKIVEHWDVAQAVPDKTASGNSMF